MKPPADELELKARIEDPAAVRRAMRRAGARLEFRGRMIDRHYDRGGELAARDEVLRLRMYLPANGRRRADGAILAWKGPASVRGEYRHRSELEIELPDSESALTLLEALRFAVVMTIDRRVEIWRLGSAMLRLEQYPKMDTLLEVEGPPRSIERAVRATGLARAHFLTQSLPYFVAAYERRVGHPARLA